jgi:hypothetical protein
MNHVRPTAGEKFHDFFQNQLIGFKLLLDAKLAFPALILLYATMDIAAYVWAGGNDNEAGARFKKFTDKYIIKYIPELTPEDLWGARCAMLHTATPESKASRKGHARQISYSWGSANIETLKKVIASERDKYVAASINALLSAFARAMEDFIADLDKDTNLSKSCMERVNKFYDVIPITKK